MKDAWFLAMLALAVACARSPVASPAQGERTAVAPGDAVASPGEDEGDTASLAPPPPARAADDVVSWFTPSQKSETAAGFSIADRDGDVVYIMSETGAGTVAKRPQAPVQRAIVARRISDGKRLWITQNAVIPLLLEQGHLVALDQDDGPTSVVLLAPKDGSVVATCSGPQPTAVAANLGSSTSIAVMRHESRILLLSTRRSWYAGGAAISQEELEASRSSTTTPFELTVGQAGCALAIPTDRQVPTQAVGTVSHRITREVSAGESRYTLVGPGGETTELGGAVSAIAQPALDGRHVLVYSGVQTPAGWRARSILWDVGTATKVAELDLPGNPSGFRVIGNRLLLYAATSVAAIDIPSGKELWSQSMSGFRYSGPYPP